MSKYNQQLGARGERLALTWLRQRGYRIIARNFSCRFGEIDIIARQGKATVFIEVKTRSSCEFGLPEDAIRQDKIDHLRRVAQYYIQRYAQEVEVRFDVISIVWGKSAQIRLIRGAF